MMQGRDKGQRGKVQAVHVEDHAVIVPGISMYKKHMKKRDEKNPGGIVDQVRPIDVSKIALICPSCGKPTRVGFLVVKGEKVRVCKKCKKKI